jgi:hypothetical protein
MLGEENLVLIVFAGVDRNTWLGVWGVSGALGKALGTGEHDLVGAGNWVSGELLRLSMRGSVVWCCLIEGMAIEVGAWKNDCV